MPTKSPLTIEPRFRINCGRRVAFGPGKAELLEHIGRTGSIREAARAMGMSYMRAWTMVKSVERGFAEPLVQRLRGGSARGGAELTKTGHAVLALYRELEQQSATTTDSVRRRFAALLAR